jgi:protein-L-isoaspartate(D-aspartate) O-methyltransferase
MVESQLRPNKVVDERLLAAMASLPREAFLPKALRPIAYVDEDIRLEGGRVLMEPMTLARLIQAARIDPDEVVLLVGLGSGYEAAVLSRLASTVVALESGPARMAGAARALAELAIDNVAPVEGGLQEGYARQAQYDVIVFNGAVARVPEAIERQLAEGGRLVAVEASPGQTPRAILAVRHGGVVARRVLFDASTPILPEFALESGFVF